MAQTQPLEANQQSSAGGNVIDLTELLKRSLGKQPGKADAPKAADHTVAAKQAKKR